MVRVGIGGAGPVVTSAVMVSLDDIVSTTLAATCSSTLDPYLAVGAGAGYSVILTATVARGAGA